MIDRGARQRRRHDREQPAHQRPPAPEVVEHRTFRDFPVIGPAQDLPGFRRVQQRRTPGLPDMGRKQAADLGDVLKPAGPLQIPQGRIQVLEQFSEAARALDPLIHLLEMDVADRQDIVRQLVLQGSRGALGDQGDQMESQFRPGLDQIMHPGGNAARHIGVGALDDEADIGHRARWRLFGFERQHRHQTVSEGIAHSAAMRLSWTGRSVRTMALAKSRRSSAQPEIWWRASP